MNRPWSEIHQSYRRLNSESGNAMLQLVSAIEASPYVDGLFAWTSHMALCITQTPVEYPCNGPFLRVSPISAETLEFRYCDTFDDTKRWHRAVPADKAFARLELFFEQLHWFSLPSTLGRQQ